MFNTTLLSTSCRYQDSEGNLVTILEISCPKSFKLIFTDVETCQRKKEVVLHDIIPRENIAASLCKFLTYYQGHIYITDLGLNLVYVFNVEERDVMVSRLQVMNGFVNDRFRYSEVLISADHFRTQPAWWWTGWYFDCTEAATLP